MATPRLAIFRPVLAAALAALLLHAAPAEAKRKKRGTTPAAPVEATAEAQPRFDPSLFQGLAWRNIGPYRGGRVTTVTGVTSQPTTFYAGATGGGVWKSEDAGNSWKNISDGHFKTGSVGSVAVAPSDPNVLYVGMGEAPVRGVATSHGDGVYRSTDAGKSWTHLGLELTRQISAVRIHPSDPDTVWVAAQGSPWKPTAERGIYRTTDGGASWEQVLFVSEEAGASDLSLDPTNPRILFAAFWDHRRQPWQVRSGGPGSGLWRSKDGGDHWEELTKGLPAEMGKIGVAVSPARPQRVWAMVEAEEGGLFRSDDGGDHWKLVNSDRLLRARAWYYSHVIADPTDAETVYVLNSPVLRSIDGGKTFERLRTPHGDNHALWISPKDGARMINGNDGGANVSFNGGATWSDQAGQPTAQFYRVITDNQFPYRVYGGQQDNSTVSIASRTFSGGIGRQDWYSVGGCESAHIAFDPDDPRYIYAGCYQGNISEWDAKTRSQRNVMAYQHLGLGTDPISRRYRFNWNAPIVASPHDPSVLFHAANVVLKSTDRGNSWSEISPDLTRDQEELQGAGGAPITNEAAGGEIYNTLMALTVSPHEPGTLWAGSDDGLVHLTRNGGESWREVTPPGMGEWIVNSIEVSPHDPATAYLAVTGYKLGDYTPHIYITRDYGASWQDRVKGIGEEAFVRVVREDPVRPGLLYAGTETGVYVSFDGADQWHTLQLKLPVVPITDLTIRRGDLIAATQGRAFWILDNLTPLRQLSDEAAAAPLQLLQPLPAYQVAFGGDRPQRFFGKNPQRGMILDYFLAEAMGEDNEDEDEVPGEETAGTAPEAEENTDESTDENTELDEPVLKLEILDAGGAVVRTLYSKNPDEGDKDTLLPTKKGHNRFAWDFAGEAPTPAKGNLPFSQAGGYRLPTGPYQARLSLGEVGNTVNLTVLPDPRLEVDPAAEAEQQALLARLWSTVDRMYQLLERSEEARGQLDSLLGRLKKREDSEELVESGQELADKLTEWEEKIIQRKSKTFQDVINFPNRFNAHLIALMDSVDGDGAPVTQGVRDRDEDLRAQWQELESEVVELLGPQLTAFNEAVHQAAVPAILLETEEDAGNDDPGDED